MQQPPYVQEQVLLAPYTTLGVGGPAEFFVEVCTLEELREATQWAYAEGLPVTILGGGSNVLVYETGVRGLVVRVALKGVEYRDTENEVFVTAQAGEVLDELCATLVEKGLWGTENLSAIPGTVGAVPVQNVGAYGVEAKDVIYEVVAYDYTSDTLVTLSNASCAFSYRDSLFKHKEGAHYIICSVTFILSRTGTPQCAYKDVMEELGEDVVPTLHEMRSVITQVRARKLPDWYKEGTAGSFFKNPLISSDVYNTLKATYPELPGFPEEGGRVKVSLGWILDKVCGLRGYAIGKVRLYEKQALVLVCEHDATANDVEEFVSEVVARVKEKTGITIEQEVRVLR